jgi:hypothetical protein
MERLVNFCFILIIATWFFSTHEIHFCGQNQESSSEAIAAFEAIALYGKSMVRTTNDVRVDKTDLFSRASSYN